MKVNKWTIGLAAAGLVSLPSLVSAEEKASPIMTALTSTTISGYVNVSAWWNPGTGNFNNPPIPYSAGKQDGFNLDVVKVTIERPLDEATWAAGYKADLLFGPDANGLATTSTGIPISDFGIKQAYVSVRAPLGNGLDFKLGVWDTIIGYETFDSGNNPNYTRSYGFAIEPTTHTGLLATYQLLENVAIAAGIANTFGPTINQKAWNDTSGANHSMAESYKTYMASVAFTAPDGWGALKGSTLYGGVINGFNTGIKDGAVETSFYAGATVATPVEGLRVGVSYDYLGMSDQTRGGVDLESAYANAVGLYTSFQATEKLSFHARGEYASQTDGLVLGSAGKLIEGTATIQYDLWKNVLSRLELRWDHAADGSDAFGGDTPGAPNRKNAYLVAANLIYKF
jgi:hypothetical protein